ncbi:AraC family transcriptional regulator [Paenibacillus sp. sptzw28]|uniref:AraC family transcriptional regulator n=1 Tax=Paenibacillus sp. sptzw28 TaxID=715179 RepID=UPI001C6E5FA4|nr:AraC family transcriptional regulator [Paenibacillus sp. sptzw28]QYR23245.1 AraC family transcriptional regulator [Paenibacillus sp. sptzw28]
MDRTTKLLLKEDRLHGDTMLPLAVYEVKCEPGEKGFECHWHDEAEFLVVLQGEALIQVDTEYFTVRAGEAVFIDGGDIHAALEAGGGTPTILCAVVFDASWLASGSYDSVQMHYITPLIERKKTFPRRIFPVTEMEKGLLANLAKIVAAYESRQPGFEILTKGLLYLMLSDLSAEDGAACDRSETGAADNAKIERLKTVIVYMQKHFQRPIRLHELSSLIPMSEGQFNRFFKAMTRTTPIEYLNAYRIKRAGEYLMMSDKKISAIAMDVGFDNLSYFIKVFRQTMKCTPSEYRKEYGSRLMRAR